MPFNEKLKDFFCWSYFHFRGHEPTRLKTVDKVIILLKKSAVSFLLLTIVFQKESFCANISVINNIKNAYPIYQPKRNISTIFSITITIVLSSNNLRQNPLLHSTNFYLDDKIVKHYT